MSESASHWRDTGTETETCHSLRFAISTSESASQWRDTLRFATATSESATSGRGTETSYGKVIFCGSSGGCACVKARSTVRRAIRIYACRSFAFVRDLRIGMVVPTLARISYRAGPMPRLGIRVAPAYLAPIPIAPLSKQPAICFMFPISRCQQYTVP